MDIVQTDISNKLRAPDGKTELELDLFHTAVWPIFVVAQCFSIMPLTNIINSSPYQVQFQFYSVGCLVTAGFLCLGGCVFLFITSDTIRAGVDAKNIVGMVFFFCGLSGCTLFARLASRWPQLIRHWTRVEVVFLAPPYKPTRWTLKQKIRISACTIAALFTVEHGLYFASNVYGYRMKKTLCNITEPPIGYEDFMRSSFEFIFDQVPYHVLVTFPLLFLNMTFTIIWNYMDLFIMLISIALATRFQQIGQRAEALARNQNTPQCTWFKIRSHYVQLCELLEVVNEQISSIILLSSLNNLYFICCQILNIFNKLQWSINYVYFWYSLFYLIGRTMFVFLCASKINDESKAPLKALRSVSTRGWGDEVERFSAHVTEDMIALSGRKLFFITRKLIFGMAATIVTYELVLLQLDAFGPGKNMPPLCG